jgi:hypothetical protein
MTQLLLKGLSYSFSSITWRVHFNLGGQKHSVPNIQTGSQPNFVEPVNWEWFCVLKGMQQQEKNNAQQTLYVSHKPEHFDNLGHSKRCCLTASRWCFQDASCSITSVHTFLYPYTLDMHTCKNWESKYLSLMY